MTVNKIVWSLPSNNLKDLTYTDRYTFFEVKFSLRNCKERTFTALQCKYESLLCIELCILIRSLKLLLVASKQCYLLSLKESFVNRTLQESRNPLKFTKYIFLSLCLFLSSCFHAVKGIWIEPT